MQAFQQAQQVMDVTAGGLGVDGLREVIPIISGATQHSLPSTMKLTSFGSSRHRYLDIGSFNSLPLYIILFNTLRCSLSISSIVPAHGPHQYLARSPGGNMLYATSWGVPARLWSWDIVPGQGDAVELKERGSTPISTFGLLD